MLAPVLFATAAIVAPPIDLITVGLITRSGGSSSRSRDPYFIQAKVDILISPNGRAVRCMFVPGSGNEAAAKAACRNYRMPASGLRPSVNGSPSHALMRVSVLYFPISPQKQVDAIEPDASLSVNHLPENAASVDVRLALAVDSTGKVIACEPGSAAEVAALVSAACGATNLMDIKAATDRRGQPISYVTRRKIRLVVIKPA